MLLYRSLIFNVINFFLLRNACNYFNQSVNFLQAESRDEMHAWVDAFNKTVRESKANGGKNVKVPIKFFPDFSACLTI